MILYQFLQPLFYLSVVQVVTADGNSRPFQVGFKNDEMTYPWHYQNHNSDGDWQGQWFPYSPGTTHDHNPDMTVWNNIYDPNHTVLMGVQNPRCDDGKRNIQIDWDFNPVNYTCYVFDRRSVYRPRGDVQAIYSRDYIPKGYSAPHRCMSEAIEYSQVLPTFGTHRPLWAKYGEYTFLPRQRWIHNLEHGAVVMLYHPCADKNEVNILKILVKKCLYKHIITPFNLLPPERPLALVTWGHKLEMSKVAPEIVIDFIKEHALKAPEKTSRDGQYSVMLEKHAEIVSDINDYGLCKLYDFMQ